MTYKKLSEITGFSVATISKAFSQNDEISEHTKEKIYDAARRCGCFDKYFKEKYNKKIIAIICPEFFGRYYCEFMETVQSELKRNNYLTIISSSDFDARNEENLIEYYALYAKVDAIIIISPSLKSIKNYSIPIVAIGSKFKNIDSISINMNNAIFNAIDLLKTNGHKKIAFIGENLTKQKEEAFKIEMKKQGFETNSKYIIRSQKRFEDAGIDGMERLLSLSEPPTAIITAYDYIAIGAMTVAKERNIKIPDDISLIGMDNISDTKTTVPPLTSIKTHMPEIAATVVDIITKKLEHPTYKIIQHTDIQAILTERRSVGLCYT